MPDDRLPLLEMRPLHKPIQDEIIQSSINCIPPLWPLENFVAVNPFLGHMDKTFFKTSDWVRKIQHGNIFMEPGYYLKKFLEKNITQEDFLRSQNRILTHENENWEGLIPFSSLKDLVNYLSQGDSFEIYNKSLSFADWVDLKKNTQWKPIIQEEISKWLSVYFDLGQSLWPMPWREENLWNAWIKASSVDQNPEWLGLKGFRSLVKSLPEKPLECISEIIAILQIPEENQVEYLQRLLVSTSGWAGYIQFLKRENGDNGEGNGLQELLAIRLVFELGLFTLFPDKSELKIQWMEGLKTKIKAGSEPSKKGLFALYLAQSILENHYQDSLISLLKAKNNFPSQGNNQKTLQAVFCIDVRSEIYRSSLESESEEIETLGFAGFFGMSLKYFPFGKEKGMNLCPVLIRPKMNVGEVLIKGNEEDTHKALEKLKTNELGMQAWNSFKSSAISCFSFVESMGLGFLGSLIQKSFLDMQMGPRKTKDSTLFKPKFLPAISEKQNQASSDLEIFTKEEIKMASEALINMGMTDRFASLVLMVGHGSQSVNNPYASSLDCGACGGHAGEINAKILVSILNNPHARLSLKKYDIHIPDTTHFLAGLHNTTTDDITVFDTDKVPPSLANDFQKVQSWIKSASKKATIKRSALFPTSQDSLANPEKMVVNNSLDWSQIRPEWGLAGNAAFIAAPRKRTQYLDLQGRVFLHNYQFDKDLDHSILELILMAPMVVATWINLQYYASTVNNKVYGSGNKTIHNVVGKLGIWQGNGGDLQTGLPLQSLHNGSDWVHEPVRLSVFLEAPKEILEEKIFTHSEVKNLILNRWITVFSIEPGTGKIYRFLGEHHWEAE